MAFKASDLTSEKSLWAIRKAARRIPPSKFNQWTVGVAGTVAIAFALLPGVPTEIYASETRKLAEMGFNFATSILGFLIAGFTVFATITKEDLFKRMAHFVEPKSKLNYLKFNFFSFMKVFIDYLTFCGLCVLIRLAAFPGGPLSSLADCTLHGAAMKSQLSRVGFALTSVSFVYILLQLKSFVFNIHHVVMTSLRWSIEEDEDRERGRKQEAARPAGPDVGQA